MIRAAHAAAPQPDYAPNSQEALLRILSSSCRWVEIDVFPLKDNLWTAHDRPQAQAAGLALPKALILINNHPGTGRTIQLDYKGVDATPLIKQLQPYADAQLVISSFYLPVLKELMVALPDFKYVYNVGWRNPFSGWKAIQVLPQPLAHLSVRKGVAALILPWLLLTRQRFFIYTLRTHWAVLAWQVAGAAGVYVDDVKLANQRP